MKDTRKKIMSKVYKLVYEAQFEKAKLYINQACNHFQLSSDEINEIISFCGQDLLYSFIKPLIKLGGILNVWHYEKSKYLLEY